MCTSESSDRSVHANVDNQLTLIASLLEDRRRELLDMEEMFGQLKHKVKNSSPTAEEEAQMEFLMRKLSSQVSWVWINKLSKTALVLSKMGTLEIFFTVVRN